MKVTSVECYKGAFITVKVNTDEGIGGFDEAELSYGSCQNVARGNYQDFAKMVIGMDSFDTEKTYEHLHCHTFWGMNGGITVSAAIVATNIACRDIKGKALGLSVYKLPGGKTHDSLRVYASQLQMGRKTPITELDRSEPQSEPKDYYDAVKGAMADRYDVVKIDPCPAGLPREDLNQTYLKCGDNLKGAYPETLRKIAVEHIATAREVGGDEFDITMEVHSTPDANTAVILGKFPESYRIMYYEEPTMPSNPEVFKYIKQKYDIPLATGERSYTRWGFRQFLEDRTLSIAQSNLCSAGGITEVGKICDMANVYDIGVQLHVCDGPTATVAALHVETVIPNFIIHGEHCANFKTDYQKAGKYAWAPENGRYVMNERPGIDQEMSEEAMASYARVVVD